jgi:RNA:NAD 2'-phosphotransferase (TPT1/KptA family)
MDDLLSYLNKGGHKKVSLDFIHEIVESNDKKRYELKVEGGLEWIRAC